MDIKPDSTSKKNKPTEIVRVVIGRRKKNRFWFFLGGCIVSLVFLVVGYSVYLKKFEKAEPLKNVQMSAIFDKKSDRHLVAWLARRYRVAPVLVHRIVFSAYMVSHKYKISPYFLLAITAVESSYNMYAQSRVGAKGLMQILPRAHPEKVAGYSESELFLPEINLDIGAQILAGYIKRLKTVDLALQKYVGRINYSSDGGYGARIKREFELIQKYVAKLKIEPKKGSLKDTTSYIEPVTK